MRTVAIGVLNKMMDECEWLGLNPFIDYEVKLPDEEQINVIKLKNGEQYFEEQQWPAANRIDES